MIAALKYRLVMCLCLLALAPPALVVACGGGGPAEPANEIDAVWEAWETIDESYAHRDSLDLDIVVSSALQQMLNLSGGTAYPFLADVGRMRGQVPPGVPGALADVWRGMAVHQHRWPETGRSDLAAAAITGITAGLGDPWAVYLSAELYPEARKGFDERLEGEYRGIGAMLVVEGDQLLMFPFRDTPAEKAGIEDGDVLLEVAGRPVDGQSLREVVSQVADQSEPKVTLLTRRGDDGEPMEIEVFRDSIDLPSVSLQLLPGGIGHLYVYNFRHNTGDQVFDALEALEQIDILALILDLRSNPGGSTEAAADMMAQFLAPGSVFLHTEGPDGVRQELRVEQGLDRVEAGELPMVVLIDQGTSGEAEAVAAVLRESAGAVLMGTQTFGAGGGYEFVELEDGSAIYMATSRWSTPSGQLLDLEGVKPDFVVPYRAGGDGITGESQFDEAYRHLNDLLPPFR